MSRLARAGDERRFNNQFEDLLREMFLAYDFVHFAILFISIITLLLSD